MIIIKTAEQINGIRKSCQLAAQCLKFIEPHVQAGITTLKLNDLIEEYIYDHEATSATLGYKGFPKATCISVNEVICHGVPNQTKLKPGDIVGIDVTTILHGYYGDTCKTFQAPPISVKTEKLLKVTQECLDIGIKQVRPWNHFGNIGYWINKHAVSQGFSVVVQYTGHHVGLDFHEKGGQILHKDRRYTGELMQENMIFTIEPMINEKSPDCLLNKEDGWTVTTVDGGLSAQFEHTLLVTTEGCEILTCC